MVDYLIKILKQYPLPRMAGGPLSKDQLLKTPHPARGLTDGQSPGYNGGCHTRNFPTGVGDIQSLYFY